MYSTRTIHFLVWINNTLQPYKHRCFLSYLSHNWGKLQLRKYENGLMDKSEYPLCSFRVYGSPSACRNLGIKPAPFLPRSAQKVTCARQTTWMLDPCAHMADAMPCTLFSKGCCRQGPVPKLISKPILSRELAGFCLWVRVALKSLKINTLLLPDGTEWQWHRRKHPYSIFRAQEWLVWWFMSPFSTWLSSLALVGVVYH